MRSLFSAICLLTTILTSSISANILGYDCGNKFISIESLKDVQKMASYSALLSKSNRKLSARFSDSKHYRGPPFTKSYLLWPIALHKTEDYEKAATLPFRAVLNVHLKVISVIELIRQEVKECKVKEKIAVVDGTHDFGCGMTFFSDKELKEVIGVACPMTQEIARRSFPARYRGPTKGRPFNPKGSQLYIFPLLKSKIYRTDDELESTYLVFNSHCKLETVVVKDEKSSYIQCVEQIKRTRKAGDAFVSLGGRVNPGVYPGVYPERHHFQ